MTCLALIFLGLASGSLSGAFGIGGGILIIPALVFIFGFSQKMASGTTVAMMLPPIGILAFLEYYRNGFVDLRAAALIITGFLAGSHFSAKYAVKIDDLVLKRSFGALLVTIGIFYIFQKK